MKPVGALLEGVATRKDHTIKAVMGFNEMSSQQMAELMAKVNKFGWFVFKENEITEKDIPDGDAPGGLTGKTHSQRLRASYFRLWEQEKPGIEFEKFYQSQMEKLINWVQEKLS